MADESSFSTAGFDHQPWATRPPEEEYYPNFTDEIFNQGRQSRTVWGGFCEGIKSELVFTSGRAEQSSAAHATTVMEPHLVPLWRGRCEEYGWAAVVDDGAPGHKGHPKKYRELNGMGMLP